MEKSASSSDKGFSRKRSKSIVAAVKSFFGRQVSVVAEEAEQVEQDESDSSSKLNSSLYSLSRKQQEAWMQACYNAVALLFFFVVGCMLVAVYYVLESFFHPLLWAVLVGMVLHPFKHMSTSGITQWLGYTRKSGIPLSLAAVFTPLFVFNWLSVRLEQTVLQRWRVITGLTVGTIGLMLMYFFNIPVHIYKGLTIVHHALSLVETVLTGSLHAMLLSLAIGFVIILLLTRGRSQYTISLQVLSCLLWFLLFLNLSVYFLGSAAVPLVVILFIVAAILALTWKKKEKKARVTLEPGLEESHYLSVLPSASSLYDDDSDSSTEEVPVAVEVDRVATATSTSGTRSVSAPHVAASSTMSAASVEEVDTGGMRKESSVTFGNVETIQEHVAAMDHSPTSPSPTSPRREKLKRSSTPSGKKRSSASSEAKHSRLDSAGGVSRRSGRTRSTFLKVQAKEHSNLVFVILVIAYFIIMCWHYPLVLFLMFPLGLWALFKRALSLSSTLGSRIQYGIEWGTAMLKKWAWLVAPPPLPTLMRMFLYADRRILRLAVRSMGSLVSAFIIIGLIVGVATTIVVVLLKVQVELSHYMTVGAKVWNMTLEGNPQLTQWLNSSNRSLTFSFEGFAKQSYEFGRVWLAQKIQSLLGESKEGTSLVQDQIIKLFDKLYHSYFEEGVGNVPNSLGGPAWNRSAGVIKYGVLFAEIKEIFFNNFEAVLSMLKSLGSIITENFSVAFSFMYAFIELLFSGGSFLFNMVVFVSTLFYLLSWSDEQYLPVIWIMDLLPNLTTPSSVGGEDQVTKEQGEAFQKAIRSVFHASFRRAFFYGVYTWLTHTILAIPVSILPSVLAGVAGAIPFVGPYWVSLPAILELWLVESRPLSAISLLVFSLLPVLFVDNLINGEIEGGHPYLTGLAIVGGIYFAGLEGALVGPILLCCLLFFMDIYGDVFNK